jgi:hypothetical protein
MYGKGSVLDLPSLRIDAIALRRGMFMDRGGRDPSTLASWEFLDSGSYAAATYDQTALTLETLEGYHGEAAVLAGLRFFFERGRFRHPGAADFYAAMSDAAGTDLKPFFDQTLRSSDRIDYATTEVSVATLEPLAGLGVQAQPAAATDTYQSTVVVERLGGAALPVDVTVIFDDGSETREQWDGQSRWRRFEYTGTQGVGHAVLDPKGALALDIDPLNNSRMREGGTRGLVRLGLRWGFWFQSLLHVLTSF